MDNKELIQQFYTSFAKGDANGMVGCYADDVVFEDPAFGTLHSERAKNMWRMLVNPNITLMFNNVWAEGDKGGAHWEATYIFSKTGNQVVNKIDAQFKFKDGKIIYHKDHFNFWKWSRQALGISGLLLGWTPLLKNKVRQTALAKLDSFKP